MSDWINIEERLPENDSLVVAALLYSFGSDPDACVCLFFDNKFIVHTDGIDASNHDGSAVIEMNFTPTHWFPLPKITK